MRKRIIAIGFLCLISLAIGLVAFSTVAEEEHPIRMTVTADPDTEMEKGGTMPFLTFTLYNDSSESYTLQDAKLSGGYDGIERSLNTEMTIDAHGKREFVLHDVEIADRQLDTDVTYTLSWTEITVIPAETPEPTSGSLEHDASETPGTGGEDTKPDKPTATPEPTLIRTKRNASAVIRVERFVLPELTVTATASKEMVSAGDTFTVIYRIANDTKFDISSIVLTDDPEYNGNIPLPISELTAGASITVPVEYTMGEEDMIFQPKATYIAAQRQTETQSMEALTVGSVIIGIKIDVQQYPSNEDGTTFAITITNTGNRTLKKLQLYDEINTQIDSPFDLAAQQQKVLSFNVPSAYSAGLVRTVRFRITGKDYFDDDFTFVDANSYDCIPYVTSDAVRLSLLATLTDAYYDDNGKLCGAIQFEIRNYSDVRITEAVLSELTLFGTITSYDELQRGETFYQSVYQLDQVDNLSFRVTAKDPSGQIYQTETIVLNLEQLPTLAARTENSTIIYHSNTFLQDLADRIRDGFRSGFEVALLLVLISGLLCLLLWGVELHLRSKLPKETLLSIRVPKTAAPTPAAIDHVLNGSPADQLGYRAPAKLRYTGAEAIKKRAAENREDSSVFAPIKRRIDEYWSSPEQNGEDGFRRRRPAPTLAAFMEEQYKTDAESEPLASAEEMPPEVEEKASMIALEEKQQETIASEYEAEETEADVDSEMKIGTEEPDETTAPVDSESIESEMAVVSSSIYAESAEMITEPLGAASEISDDTAVTETAVQGCMPEESAEDATPISDLPPEAVAAQVSEPMEPPSETECEPTLSAKMYAAESETDSIKLEQEQSEQIPAEERTVVEAMKSALNDPLPIAVEAESSLPLRTVRIIEIAPHIRRKPLRPNRIVHIR